MSYSGDDVKAVGRERNSQLLDSPVMGRAFFDRSKMRRPPSPTLREQIFGGRIGPSKNSKFMKSDSALSITEGCFWRRPRLTDRRGNLEDVVISSALTKIR